MVRMVRLGVDASGGVATVSAWVAIGFRKNLSGILSSPTFGIGVSVLLYLLLCLVFLGVTQERADAQSAWSEGFDEGERRATIRILESNEQRIVLEVEPPAYSLSERVVDGIAYDVVSIPDWGMTDEAGAPQLPNRRVMVGVPAGAEIRLEVVGIMAQEDGPYQLMPAPDVVLGGDPLAQTEPRNQPPQFEERVFESPAIYEKDALHPGVIANVAEVGSMRSQRVVAIDLYPIQYNPVTSRIVFHSQFRVELSLSYPPRRTVLEAAGPENPSFEALLQGHILNYPSTKEWRGKLVEPIEVSGAAADWPLAADSYKIYVSEDGLYQLTYDDLAGSGVPVDLETFDPHKIQIFSGGEEVAIRVVGEEDDRFDAEDYVLFYGQGISNKYTARNVYWLTHGQALGRRMPKRNGKPGGTLVTPAVFASHLLAEEDLVYVSQWPGDDSTDRWVWHRLLAYPETPVGVTINLALGHVVSDAMPNTLRVVLKGGTFWPTVNPDHHAEFRVNGYYVGEHWWDGNGTIEVVNLDVPPSYLKAGTNSVWISLPGDADVPENLTDYVDFVLLDRIELSYGHAYRADSNRLRFNQASAGTWAYEISDFTESPIEVFDISAPASVTQIISPAIEPFTPTYTVRFSDTSPSTVTYLVAASEHWLSPEGISKDLPSDLHSRANGADYIVITHASFEPAAQTLASYRAAQGLRTVVVDLEDVYDEFGYGLSIPQAIRDFVQYAYEQWQEPAPSYLVLLGDGTYDPKNHLDQGVVSFMPPYLAFVDPWMGETATDNWYVAVAGDDDWPDLFLGRLPANTLAEANEMVRKTITYEQSLPDDGWNGRIAFVAGKQPDATGAGNFHDLSDDVISGQVPAFYEVSKIYLGAIPGSTCNLGSACRQRLVDTINAGTLLVNYIGHGSVIQWDGAYILGLGAINQLTNSGRYPIMLPMTCLEGMFTSPDPLKPSISESVVRATDKGAVASWGPTGLGVASGHDHLNKGFLQAALWDGIREIGAASYAGKLRLDNAGTSSEQILEYTVFGDPALRIHSLEVVDVRVEKSVEGNAAPGPGDVLTFTLSFTNTGPDVAIGVVLSDSLPSFLLTPTVVYSSPEVLLQHAGVTFAWTISDLLPHTGGEVRIRAVIDPDAEYPVSFFNSAVISTTTAELVPSNNRSWIGINTSKAYLPLILKEQ